MIQFSYAPASVAGLLKNPTDRTKVVEALAEKLGGKLVGNWLCFGEYDGIAIIEGADNVSAVACSMAVTASGAFTKFKTTPLLSGLEGVAAMRQASTLGYTPPTAG